MIFRSFTRLCTIIKFKYKVLLPKERQNSATITAPRPLSYPVDEETKFISDARSKDQVNSFLATTAPSLDT